MAIAGVDVSGVHHGGTTAVSDGTVVLGIEVTPVNDAPIATGSATLGSVNQSDPHPPGSPIGTLFGGDFSDGADQQQSAKNPTGSSANTFAGIAIVGDGASASQGKWQYSSDGGKTWTDIPASGLSDSNALVLSSSDSLRFLPSGTFSGTPGALTVRLIDSSGPAPIKDTAGVDLGAVGGTSPYSAGTVQLTTQVTATNRPFLPSAPLYVPDYNAPNDYNKLSDAIQPGDRVDPRSPFAATQQKLADPAAIPPVPGRGYRPNLYGEPIIPQVWLTGSVGNRFIIEQQQAIIQVPSDLFNDTYPNAQLEYEARAPGGGPLPAWLIFDARSLTFAGTPPLGARGTVEVEIVAHDQFGNHATATFQITVGRESHDVEQMLARLSPDPRQAAHAAHKEGGSHKAPEHARQDARAHAAGSGDRSHAAPNDVPSHSAPSHPAERTNPQHDAGRDQRAPHTDAYQSAPGRSAFSAQLRDAGPIGKIIQARQMVRSIVEAVSGDVGELTN
jgi:hypothetical protein